ncbi:N-acetylmuramoyl-L-alanine amidase [Vallitalea pronyensis]|uniref:N-acetylmuramoyl-L-alanine amidase n=1 Tax=Vallitalea pronyensis TaxID=1348613 RepID=A0A8J8SF38_9FIRM|nr:N-acetylmuramoyl-L-alanine amidase [Vallitalea pronyensis]QUI20863.1 N-acetylmuramoyl-L-alanine amidase [Vallitalea pronyensis]
MKIKERLGYSPLLIMDAGYSEQMYSVNRTLLPVATDENYIIRRMFNTQIANKILEKAHELGFAILNVVPETYDVSLETRVNRANANFLTYSKKYSGVVSNRLGIYLAVHYDPKACDWDDYDDLIHITYEGKNTNSRHLAYLVHHALIDDQYKGTIKFTKTYLLKQTTMCAIHIDASFMDIKDELYWMFQEDFIDDIANRIVTGCLRYYGIKDMDDLIKESSHHMNEIESLQERIQALEKLVEDLKNKK